MKTKLESFVVERIKCNSRGVAWRTRLNLAFNDLPAGSLALAQVSADDDEVHGVAHPVQVVFLQLQPVVGAAGNLVGRLLVQRFHHQALAVIWQREISF